MRDKTIRCLVLLSGGIDSAVCVHLLQSKGSEVSACFVDYGQPAALQEVKAVRALAEHFGIELQTAKLSTNRGFTVGEILGRNAFLVFTALMAFPLRTGQVVLGIHKGTPYYDCSPAFVTSVQLLLSEHTDSRVRLNAPLIHWTKAEILDYSLREGLPIKKTYSCEAGSDPPCGTCLSCLDRLSFDASTKTTD